VKKGKGAEGRLGTGGWWVLGGRAQIATGVKGRAPYLFPIPIQCRAMFPHPQSNGEGWKVVTKVNGYNISEISQDARMAMVFKPKSSDTK